MPHARPRSSRRPYAYLSQTRVRGDRPPWRMAEGSRWVPEEPPGCPPPLAARQRTPSKGLELARHVSGGCSDEGDELWSCSLPRRYHLASHPAQGENIAFRLWRHLHRGRRDVCLGTALHTRPGGAPGSTLTPSSPKRKPGPPKNYMQHRWKTGRTALRDASGSGLRCFAGSTAPSPGWLRPRLPTAPPESISPGRGTLRSLPLEPPEIFSLFVFICFFSPFRRYQSSCTFFLSHVTASPSRSITDRRANTVNTEGKHVLDSAYF